MCPSDTLPERANNNYGKSSYCGNIGSRSGTNWASVYGCHNTPYGSDQNGVILFALGVGAVSLLIITRGKWQK